MSRSNHEMPGSSAAGYASDANVVHKTGAETVAGVKTFSSSPVVPAPGSATDASTKQYVDELQPTIRASDLGFLGWNYDPALAVNTQALTNGTHFMFAIFLRKAVTITNMHFVVNLGSTSPTSGQNWTGLYNSAGTLLTSAALDTPIASTGLKTVAFGTPQPVSAGFVWVSLLGNASSAGTLGRGTGITTGINATNGLLTAANYRACVNGTSLTTLPSPSITPASNSLTGATTIWVAVS